jgi:hypothetical protein
MGGSSIIFTSMAAGMILSVSWGTDESRLEAQEADGDDPGSETQQERPIYEAAGPLESEIAGKEKRNTAAEMTGRRKEKKKRTEFDQHA